MTIEQQRALALAEARMRMDEAAAAKQEDLTLAELAKKGVDKMDARYNELVQKAKGGKGLEPSEMIELAGMGFISKTGRGIADVVGAAPGMAIRTIPVVVGGKAGEFSRIPGGQKAGQVLGGVVGEVAGSLYEGQPMTMGRLASAGLTAAINSKSLARATPAQVTNEMARMGAANVAAGQLESVIDTGRLETDPAAIAKQAVAAGIGVLGQKALDTGARAQRAAVKQANEAPARQTLRTLSDAGVKISPSLAIPNEFEKSIAALVRKDLNLGPTAKLDERTISRRISTLEKVYDQAGKISTDAETALTAMKGARGEARRLWKQYNASNGTRQDLAELARQMDVEANGFEQLLIDEAAAKGQEKVARKLIETRPQYAKARLADRSMNYARGVPDAKEYADYVDKGGKLSGHAAIIADAWKANQQKQERFGSLLSRTLTLAKMAEGAVEKSALGQAAVKRPPPYVRAPDVAADLFRMSMMREGRNEPEFDMGQVSRFMTNPAPMMQSPIGR